MPRRTDDFEYACDDEYETGSYRARSFPSVVAAHCFFSAIKHACMNMLSVTTEMKKYYHSELDRPRILTLLCQTRDSDS